jgi:ribosomal protein S6
MDQQNLQEKTLRDYELAFLILSEDTKEEILSLLKTKGVELSFIKEPEKTNLAYPIKHFTQAFFGFINFKAEPQKSKELEKDLKNIKNLLRFMIISDGFIKQQPQTRRKSEDSKKEKAPQQIITNEVLEKKLEEMLQE